MKKQANLFQFYNKSKTKSSNIPSTIEKSVPKESNIPDSDLKLSFDLKSALKNEPINSQEDEDLIVFTKPLKKMKIEDSDSDSPLVKRRKTLLEDSIFNQNKENIKQEEINPEKEKGKKPKKNLKSNQPTEEKEIFNTLKETDEKAVIIDEFDDKTPWWATKERCKDKQMRIPTDSDYDPTTLYIPPEEKKGLTPTMRQFWEIKSDNFDKVLFFKLGKFYELFYEDAYIGNKYLDLNWMGRKMHVGFPEKALERYAMSLVGQGFKVAVIEQTETPKQMEERLKSTKKLSGVKEEKTIQRKLVEVRTRGTYVSTNEENPEPKYLLSIRIGYKGVIGICILESTTNYITLGMIEDDQNYTNFKTFVCQIRPAEIIFDPDNINSVILKILTTGHFVPVQSTLPNKKNKWHSGVSYNFLEKIHGDFSLLKWPEILQLYYQDNLNRDIVFATLSGLFSYLEQVLILDKVINSARYGKYDPKIGLNKCLILDSQALQHLEILESNTPIKSSMDGSLLSFINRAITFGGKRMIKRWLCAPLLSIDKINDRLDAVEDLQKFSFLRDKFRKDIGNLPDLERLCTKFYQYSIKQTNNAVYFEDVSALRLREFNVLLKNLVKAESIIFAFQEQAINFKSSRLKKLVSYQSNPEIIHPNNYQDIYYEDNTIEESGLLPKISENVEYISSMIVWQGKDKDKLEPSPQKGFFESYDNNMEKVDEIKSELQSYLISIRKRFGDHSIDYCHAKYRYELEIPEKIVKGTKKPEDLEFTSARAGFQRFLTQEIKEIVERLEIMEDKIKEDIKDFAQFIFNYFRESYNSWDTLNSILAELDCLCSLSVVSFYSDGIMCRPNLLPLNDFKGPKINFEETRHPCVCMTGIDFIPNDIKIDSKFLMLLTGPNMGGKSTVLRMLCINIILAQLGCYVPARSCEMTLVDRIFTRIGASDKLMEGKSTFYIEMEETLNIVKSGTINSIAILDELGRGTSTFDGVALAYSVLKYILENLKCRTIFATHYHVLIEEFRMYKEITFYHMAANVDPEKEKVIFLYKLKEGECNQSFGINVAKVVGIDQKILAKAKEKAGEFEERLNMQNINKINSVFNNYVSLLDKNFDESSEMEIENEIKEEFNEKEENNVMKKMILQKIK